MTSQAEQSTIKHFSHPHPLHLSNHQNSSTLISCSGCKLKPTGLIYSCSTCNYFLHVKCSKMPRQITHPSDHKDHILQLRPKPVNQEGFFNCSACKKQGNGFSYHCKVCDTDLHILCAAMPLKFTHQSHNHQLKLIFSPPHQNKIFNCDICNTLGGNHWLYRCHDCDFDVHLNCVNNVQETKPSTFSSWQNQTPNPQAPNHHFQDHGTKSRFAPQVPPQNLNYQPFNQQFSGTATGYPVPNFTPNGIPENQGFHPNVDPFLERQNAEYLLALQRLQALFANTNYANMFNQPQMQIVLAAHGGGLGGGVGGRAAAGADDGGGGRGGKMQRLIQVLSMVADGVGNYAPGPDTLQGLLGAVGGLEIFSGSNLTELLLNLI